MSGPPRFSRDDALRHLKRLLANGRIVRAKQRVKHRDERQKQRSITDLEWSHAARCGSIRAEPELSNDGSEWRYCVEGKDQDGRFLHSILMTRRPQLRRSLSR